MALYIPHSIFPFGAAFVCQAGNFWTTVLRMRLPVPVAARGSAAARLLGFPFRIPPWAWMFVVSVLCCQVEFSSSCRSLVQRIPTEYGVSECDRKTAIMRTAPAHWGLLRGGRYDFPAVGTKRYADLVS